MKKVPSFVIFLDNGGFGAGGDAALDATTKELTDNLIAIAVGNVVVITLTEERETWGGGDIWYNFRRLNSNVSSQSVKFDLSLLSSIYPKELFFFQ